MPKKENLLTKIEKADIFKKIQKFLEEKVAPNPEPYMKLGLWAAGTVMCHNLNLAGMISWFGSHTDRIGTGLPPPFHLRRRFPWERAPTPTWEDKITEWAAPALTSWMLVYHPEAIAKFIDAMIPF